MIAAAFLLSVLPMTQAATKLTFEDVRPFDWFYDSVAYVYNRGIMDGVSTYYFDPNGGCSRAVVVQALYNLSDHPLFFRNGIEFTDVPPSSPYYEAVAWAVAEEITYGYGDGIFGPDDTITREQLATFFLRYARYRGLNADYQADFSEFGDAGKVSDYALTAMRWAVAVGLIKGTDEKLLEPQQTATRAQFATIIMRLAEGYGY